MADNEDQKAIKAQKREYTKRIADYLKTFTSAHGKRVLKDMRLSYCGHFEPSKDLGSMGFEIGQRQVVKDIEALLLTGKNPQLIEDLFRQPEDDDFEL